MIVVIGWIDFFSGTELRVFPLYHAPISAYLDLDGFKAVNDRLGHEAGDDVLCRVADALRLSTRPSDLCARLGGDEFVVLLAEADAGEAVVAVERVRLRVSERLAPGPLPVSCSIGIVAFKTAPATVEEMIPAADARMYLAKAAGKGWVHLEVAPYETFPPTAQRKRLSRRSRLKDAGAFEQ